MTGNRSDGVEIKVFATAAIQEAYNTLVPRFAQTGPHKVATEWVPTVDLMQRMKAGGIADLVFMSAAGIDELIRDGKLVDGSRVDIAKSGIGIAVRVGAARPDISSADALRAAILAAKSVSYSTGPSGVYLAGLFDRMGLTAALEGKLKVVKGEPIGAVVARGDAEIGFQQVPELLPVKGIDLVGPLPPEIQQVTTFAAGRPIAAKHVDAGAALLAFLKTPAALDVFRSKGMDPA